MLHIIASIEHAASITIQKGDTVAVTYDGSWWLAGVQKIWPLGAITVAFSDATTIRIPPSQVGNTDVIRLVNAPKIHDKPLTQNAVDKITLLKRPKLVPPPAAKPKVVKPVPPVTKPGRTAVPKSAPPKLVPKPKPPMGGGKRGTEVVFDDDEPIVTPVPPKPRLVPKPTPPKPAPRIVHTPTPTPVPVPKQPDPEPPVHKSPPAPKDAEGAPHLRLPPLLAARYKTVQYGSKPSQILFMKSLWTHFNEERFDGKMVMPTIFRHLKEVSVDKMRKRAHWLGPRTREIAVSPRLFYADQDYFTEIFLHEMCHQAVCEIDKYFGREEQDHGSHWKAWMVRVGLDPRRFDPQPNSTYMTPVEKRLHDDKQRKLQENKEATQRTIQDQGMVSLTRGQLVTGAFVNAVINGVLTPGRLIINDPKRPQFWLVLTTQAFKSLGQPKNSFPFASDSNLYALKDTDALNTPVWKQAMFRVCMGFIEKYYGKKLSTKEYLLSKLPSQLGLDIAAPTKQAVPYLPQELKMGMAVDMINNSGYAMGNVGRLLVQDPGTGYWLVMEPHHYNSLMSGGRVNTYTSLNASDLCKPLDPHPVMTESWTRIVHDECARLIRLYYTGNKMAFMISELPLLLGMQAPSRIGKFNLVAPPGPFRVSADVEMRIADVILELITENPYVRGVYKGWVPGLDDPGRFDRESGKLEIPRYGLDNPLPMANSVLDQANRDAVPGGVKAVVVRAFWYLVDRAVNDRLSPANKGAWHLAKKSLWDRRKFAPSKRAGDKPGEWFAEQFAAETLGRTGELKPLHDLVQSFLPSSFNALPSANTADTHAGSDLPASIQADVDRGLAAAVSKWPSLSAVRVLPGDPDLFSGNSENMLATIDSKNVIYNPARFADVDFWTSYTKEHRHFVVDATTSGVIIHECGHIANTEVMRKLGAPKYNKFISRLMPGLDFASIANEYTTPYGQTNIQECMAELFSLWVSGRPMYDHDLGQMQYDNAVRVWTAAKAYL